MKRIFFERYGSEGKFPDGRVKLDVYFRSSDGEGFVWTPDWEKGTRHFFLEAYRIEKLNRPESAERGRFKRIAEEVIGEEEAHSPTVNFRLRALRLGEGLKGQTTVNEVRRIASAVFDFTVSSHPLDSITSIRSQTVYDCVMSLAEQPMSDERKLELLREFVVALTPEGSPLRELAKNEKELLSNLVEIPFQPSSLIRPSRLPTHASLVV